MKLKNVLFTAVLIMAICVSCAHAGQTAAEETEVEEETAGSDQKEAYRKSVGALFEEDGNYQIADAVLAEKGDNLVLSLEEMCSQVGMTTDECLESQAENRVFVLYDLENYMEEHPEVKGIEYDGEIRTAEELDAIWDAELEELYGDESAD